MKKALLSGVAGLLVSSSAVLAGGFDFEFTATGGAITDNNITLFPILLDDPNAPGKSVPFIQTMQLELTGLSHTFPDDLDIYLIDPSLNSIKVMTDRGGGQDVTDITLIFDDAFAAIPSDAGPLVAGDYRSEGLAAGVDNGFAEFTGQSGGTMNWLLLIIDDAVGDLGSLDSFTLRGTVPEPATLGLLALGAVATFARRRNG